MTKQEKDFLRGVLKSLHDDYNKEVYLVKETSEIECARRYTLIAKRCRLPKTDMITIYIPNDSDMFLSVTTRTIHL